MTSFKYFSKDFGVTYYNKDNLLEKFREKKISFFNYVYSGVSIINNELLNCKFNNNLINIEDFYFKNKSLSINVYKSNFDFIDIGTKKSYNNSLMGQLIGNIKEICFHINTENTRFLKKSDYR